MAAPLAHLLAAVATFESGFADIWGRCCTVFVLLWATFTYVGSFEQHRASHQNEGWNCWKVEMQTTVQLCNLVIDRTTSSRTQSNSPTENNLFSSPFSLSLRYQEWTFSRLLSSSVVFFVLLSSSSLVCPNSFLILFYFYLQLLMHCRPPTLFHPPLLVIFLLGILCASNFVAYSLFVSTLNVTKVKQVPGLNQVPHRRQIVFFAVFFNSVILVMNFFFDLLPSLSSDVHVLSYSVVFFVLLSSSSLVCPNSFLIPHCLYLQLLMHCRSPTFFKSSSPHHILARYSVCLTFSNFVASSLFVSTLNVTKVKQVPGLNQVPHRRQIVFFTVFFISVISAVNSFSNLLPFPSSDVHVLSSSIVFFVLHSSYSLVCPSLCF